MPKPEHERKRRNLVSRHQPMDRAGAIDRPALEQDHGLFCETPADLMERAVRGGVAHGLSDGRWSMINLIESICSVHPGCQMTIGTWRINKKMLPRRASAGAASVPGGDPPIARLPARRGPHLG